MSVHTTIRPGAGGRAGEAERPSLAVFVSDEETRDAVSAALGVDWPAATITQGSIDDAIHHVSSDPSARILIVEISGASDPLAALDRLAEVCAPGTFVVALGDINDVGFYRTLRSTGVADYLVKPITAEALGAALQAIRRRSAAPEPEKASSQQQAAGRVFAVVGARGGVGTTTVATTLSWLFARDEGRRTMLVDFDIHCGAAALALDSEPGHGLCEALESPSRIDALFLSSAAVSLDDKLFLLCSEEPLDAATSVRPGAFERLTAELRRDFERIVMDLPRGNPEVLRHGFAEANTIVIVTDFSLLGLRDTDRLMRLAKSAATSAKVVVVANRVGAAKKGEIPRAEVEKTIKAKLAAVIPEDNSVVPQATNTGKTVVEVDARSKVSVALSELAKSLGESTKAAAPQGIVARLVGAVKKPTK